jgi:hypothetical protein
LSYGHPDFNVLTSVLESESNVLINWFKDNKMQANPDKFQVLAVGKNHLSHLFPFIGMLRPISKWEKEFFFNCIIIQQYRVQN